MPHGWLVEEAVAAERVRIDGDVRRRLGAALESIAARGQQMSDVVERDPATLEDGLRALVDDSRRTLAEARQMISGYQQPSLRAELDTAATVLTAAGITTELVLPRGELPDTVDPSVRLELRSAIARLLGDNGARRCVITVTRVNGQLRAEVRSADTDLTAREEAAA